MRKRRVSRYSGIGGQAVLEGIMMKNKEQYAVAVRKPDGEIEVEVDTFHGVMHGNRIKEIPFIRGVFNFIDSLTLGTKSLNFSASFYDEEESKETKTVKIFEKLFRENAEKILMGATTVFAAALAIAIFIVLPYFLADYLREYIRNDSLMAIIEGVIRILIFLLYVIGISAMKDIKRVYQYHGAEHKCINCIEKGRVLNVRNVMRSSRLHRRCGTSFMFFVMFVSIILFFFIRVENPVQRIVIRILLIPVVAGISYEIIRLAGRSNNIFLRILSAPGMCIQRLTTKEPDADMVEVAIKAVEAVFDWKEYLYSKFDYEREELEEPGETGGPKAAGEADEPGWTEEAEPTEEPAEPEVWEEAEELEEMEESEAMEESEELEELEEPEESGEEETPEEPK